jgi:hypothetical protein
LGKRAEAIGFKTKNRWLLDEKLMFSEGETTDFLWLLFAEEKCDCVFDNRMIDDYWVL